MLNRHAEIELSDAVVVSVNGAPPLTIARVLLYRDDLFAVHLGGPRGDRLKQQAFLRVALGLKVGPYLVRGQIHVPPGADPIKAFRRGRRMVPLTDAWIEFRCGDDVLRQRVPALMVNRLLADWVVLSPAEPEDEAPDQQQAS